MSCSCNGYCNNQDCSTHIAACSNSYSFSAIGTGYTIHSVYLNELQIAVNGAYTRRGLSLPSWPSYPIGSGATVTVAASHHETCKTNINALHAGLVTSIFTAGQLIYASQTAELQSDANVVRNECICDYNCTCNINCSCNVNCVCNYHPNILRREIQNG